MRQILQGYHKRRLKRKDPALGSVSLKPLIKLLTCCCTAVHKGMSVGRSECRTACSGNSPHIQSSGSASALAQMAPPVALLQSWEGLQARQGQAAAVLAWAAAPPLAASQGQGQLQAALRVLLPGLSPHQALG